MKLTRTYNLALYSNKDKLEIARYTYVRHLTLTNHWTKLLFRNGNISISTAKMGQLANQAQHKARGIISALREAEKATKRKASTPEIERVGCPANLEPSENSFDYWLTVENEFTKTKRVALPVKSHRKLNDALRSGWKLIRNAELFQDKNGGERRI